MKITLLDLQSFIKQLPKTQQTSFLSMASVPFQQLFKYLLEQSNITENSLKNDLKDLFSQNLNLTYCALFQQILLFLNQKRHSIVDEVHGNLKSIQTLYELKQFSLCHRLLAETHTLAIENELFEAIHEILIWQRTLTYYDTGYEKNVEATFRTTIEVCQKLSNLWQYSCLLYTSDAADDW